MAPRRKILITAIAWRPKRYGNLLVIIVCQRLKLIALWPRRKTTTAICTDVPTVTKALNQPALPASVITNGTTKTYWAWNTFWLSLRWENKAERTIKICSAQTAHYFGVKPRNLHIGDNLTTMFKALSAGCCMDQFIRQRSHHLLKKCFAYIRTNHLNELLTL